MCNQPQQHKGDEQYSIGVNCSTVYFNLVWWVSTLRTVHRWTLDAYLMFIFQPFLNLHLHSVRYESIASFRTQKALSGGHGGNIGRSFLIFRSGNSFQFRSEPDWSVYTHLFGRFPKYSFWDLNIGHFSTIAAEWYSIWYFNDIWIQMMVNIGEHAKSWMKLWHLFDK